MGDALKRLKNLAILYVENEEEVLEKYLPFLETHCQKLYIASEGKGAFKIYQDKKPDIVLMDLFISKFDGITLAKKIRDEGDDVTFLIALTNHADQETLLEIVDLDFSSYLVKPIDSVALLNALLKISKELESGEILSLAYGCSWDSQSRRLFWNNEYIVLTKREQKLFELFIDKNGTACSNDEIFFYVWEDDFDRTVTNDSIRTLVKNLRKKIPKELIKNQYGVGYKLTF